MNLESIESDPIRQAILNAIDRLLAGEPLRSSGRLSVSQLAVEADVPRWHLTHQHLDLKELFQSRVRNADGAPAAFARRLSDYEDLKARHAQLVRDYAELEERLQLYAAAINVLAAEQDARKQDRRVPRIADRRARR